MNNLIKCLAFVTLLVFTYSCENPTESSLVYDDGSIRELVLRDKFHNNGSGWFNYGNYIDTTYKVYFIGFYEEVDSNYIFRGDAIDPTDDFLTRFNGFIKKVKKRSDCEKVGADFIDKVTKEKGLIFRVGPINWISETEAEVEAGYYAGFAAADCYSYRLYKEKGKWYIYYKTPRWHS
jgi:hypothetical protein